MKEKRRRRWRRVRIDYIAVKRDRLRGCGREQNFRVTGSVDEVPTFSLYVPTFFVSRLVLLASPYPSTWNSPKIQTFCH